MVRISDEEANEDGAHAGSDTVDVGDVAGLLFVEVVDDHEEGREESVPDEPGDEDDAGEQAGTKDGTIGDELEGKERNWCNVLLVKNKANLYRE